MLPAELLPLAALILPFVAWLLEWFLPYPYLVEELLKTLLVLPLGSLASRRQQLTLAAILGVLFTLSESVLYFLNLNFHFNLTLLFTRLLATGFLHVATTFILALALSVSKKLLLVILPLTIFLHYVFNHTATSLLNP